MKFTTLRNALSIGALAFSTSLPLACGGDSNQPAATAIDLTSDATCASDGMMLMEFEGPKAQILWKNGERSYFCEAREAFEFWTNPIERNRMDGFFVQDFGGIEWGAYPDRWIRAQDATYVIGSNKLGAMGITYVSFSKPSAASSFQLRHGGRSLLLEEITLTVFESSLADQIRQLEKGFEVE